METKYTVLWLEDSVSDIPSYIRELSKTLKATVLFVKNISEAITIAKTKQINLFLLDIEITGERMTGIEFAEQLRSSCEYYMTPILFVSSYSHLSRHLFTTIQNCKLLTKPYTEQALETAMGSLLGIYDYVKKSETSLLIPVKRESAVEIDSKNVCYIEFLKDNAVHIQLNHGECVKLNCQRSGRKYILDQIEQKRISHLVQIYRSIIINVNQIKTIEFDRQAGNVYLFSDDVPKPIGTRYRDNLKNFL